MASQLRLFALLIFVSSATAAYAGEKPWIEGKSPHFRVLTDSSAGDARRVLFEFEQMRSVFATRFPGFRLDSGAPLVIFAAHDEDTAKALAPALWKQKGAKPAGYFQHSWEQQYALVRMDTWGQGAHEVVYHEYTHMVLGLNAHWIPVWLNEGFAEFYAYTRFQQKETYIGAPSERYRMLGSRPLIPIETLISVDHRSPYYHDEDKVQVFYAEAWALVHFLQFGPGMEQGKKLSAFFAKVQSGTPQKQAFEETFGSFKSMDEALGQYVRQVAFTAGRMPSDEHLNEKDFPTRTLSMAETQAELAGYHLWTHDHSDAKNYATDALKNDPNLGLALEVQGFLDLSAGKSAEALAEFTKAFANDHTLYLSLFAKTMLSPQATSEVPADQAAFKQGLTETLALNPQFAPAFIQLARLSIRQNDPNAALGFALKAEKLEPSRAGYYLVLGQILVRTGHFPEAAKIARFVSDRWYGPDHNEALELWNAIPEAQRTPGDPMLESKPKDTARAEGIIKEVNCGGENNDKEWSLTLLQNDKTITFHRDKGFPWGFADSIWYGEDHINICHYLEGHRAIVHFRPATDATYEGTVAELEIRDDLPATMQASTKPKPSDPQATPPTPAPASAAPPPAAAPHPN